MGSATAVAPRPAHSTEVGTARVKTASTTMVRRDIAPSAGHRPENKIAGVLE
jgi:hypothetical protein